MVEIIVSLLAIALLIWVLWPLVLSPQPATAGGQVSAGNGALRALLQKKETIYSNIRDLRFEHQMGKLSDTDFKELEAGYHREAAELLKKIDGLGGAASLEETLEQEVRDYREKGASAPGVCPACGKNPKPEHQFCTGCGAALQTLQCKNCGADIQPNSKFCSQCGQQH